MTPPAVPLRRVQPLSVGAVHLRAVSTVVLLLAGGAINSFAYESLQPVVLAAMFLTFGWCAVRTVTRDRYSRAGFSSMFAVGWFMSGVAAIYANVFQDPFQLGSDASAFFSLSSGEAGRMLIHEIRTLTEGSGAVVLWRVVYDLFSNLGFDRQRYVGVLFNVLAMSLTVALAARMATLIYGADSARQRRLLLMCTFCGLFWMFSAIHLRDAVVTLATTLVTFVWVRYLCTPTSVRFVVLLIVSAAGSPIIGLLRTEFYLVPILMAVAGAGALVLRGTQKPSVVAFYLFVLATVLLGLGLYLGVLSDVHSVLSSGGKGYAEHVKYEAASDSLGASLIVNQGTVVRVFLGTAYLFVFPIPVWSGFQLESALHLFRSFNGVFYYFILPLIALAIYRLYRAPESRTPVAIFVLFVSIGFTAAIGVTSLEQRHVGAFLIPIFLLCLIPSMENDFDRKAYRIMFFLVLLAMSVLHIFWLLLKFAD